MAEALPGGSKDRLDATVKPMQWFNGIQHIAETSRTDREAHAMDRIQHFAGFAKRIGEALPAGSKHALGAKVKTMQRT